LFVLTKEFPDWDLGKIAEFINEGKTKNDLIQRDLRKYKKDNEEIAKNQKLE